MAARGGLSEDALMRRAMRHLARHAASTARVREVLSRAIRRAAGEAEPPDAAAAAALIEPVMARLARAGLLDDAAFARGRAARLAAKGKPAVAIRAELKHRHGVDVDDQALAETLAALDPLEQATRWAQRRRLGPFRLRQRAERRDRDVASLARAGFAVAIAITVVDGDGEAEASPLPDTD